jgi:hypothetical protein
LTFISIFLAFFDSKWLVPYILGCWAFSPEIRRIIDWQRMEYHSVTPLSLIPILATLSLLVPVILRSGKFSPKMIQALLFVSLSSMYAFLIGIAKNGSPAIYEAFNTLSPLLFIPYMAKRKFDSDERDFWISSLVTVGIVVSVYGWLQFLFAFPWDMLWMVKSGMSLSMGPPLPLGFRVFSTLNSTGTTSIFLVSAIAPACLNERWRTKMGWGGVVLMISVLAITQVRSSWLALLVCLFSYILLSTGKNKWQSIIGLAIMLIMCIAVMPLLPGGSAVTERLNTFQTMQNDNSARTRINIVTSFSFMKSPFGDGMGSTGIGGKIGATSTDQNGSFDNGWLALYLTYGIVGFFALIIGLARVVQCIIERKQLHIDNSYINVGLSILIMSACLLFGNQILSGYGGIMAWFFASISLGLVPKTKPAATELAQAAVHAGA